MNYETNYEFLKIISFDSFPRPSRKMPKNTAISSSVSRSSESQWVRTIESTKAFWKWNIPGAERSHRLLSNAPLEFQLLYFTLRIRLDAFAFFGTTILRTTFCRSLSALTWSPSEKAHSRQKSAHKRWGDGSSRRLPQLPVGGMPHSVRLCLHPRQAGTPKR
jgi:hypothetical protein